LRVSYGVEVIHLSMTFYISRWASAFLLCCMYLLHAVNPFHPSYAMWHHILILPFIC
jgi:hypothetical protein